MTKPCELTFLSTCLPWLGTVPTWFMIQSPAKIPRIIVHVIFNNVSAGLLHVNMSLQRNYKSSLGWPPPNKALLLMKGWSYFEGQETTNQNQTPVCFLAFQPGIMILQKKRYKRINSQFWFNWELQMKLWVGLLELLVLHLQSQVKQRQWLYDMICQSIIL